MQENKPVWPTVILVGVVGYFALQAFQRTDDNEPSPSPQKGTVAVAAKVFTNLHNKYADAADAMADAIDESIEQAEEPEDIITFSQVHKDWQALNKEALSESFAPLDGILQEANDEDDIKLLSKELRSIAKGFRKK